MDVLSPPPFQFARQPCVVDRLLGIRGRDHFPLGMFWCSCSVLYSMGWLIHTTGCAGVGCGVGGCLVGGCLRDVFGGERCCSAAQRSSRVQRVDDSLSIYNRTQGSCTRFLWCERKSSPPCWPGCAQGHTKKRRWCHYKIKFDSLVYCTAAPALLPTHTASCRTQAC